MSKPKPHLSIVGGTATAPAVAAVPAVPAAPVHADAELLRLGAELEQTGQEWFAHCMLDEQNSREYDARCEAAGLPYVEFEKMPSQEAWLAYQNKRHAVGKLPNSGDFWDRFHARQGRLIDDVRNHQPQTFAGLAVLAHAAVLDNSEWWDDDDSFEQYRLVRTFLEAFCKFAGILLAPIQKVQASGD